MSDGKVMQKYYPPDFDPEALKNNRDILKAARRGKKGGTKGLTGKCMDMRMMFPFTLCCGSCKDFIYVGTKFNSKVLRVKNMSYLTIPIWRFIGRCPHCRNQIIFRTDPKNTDYVLESGGTRTYDSNRDVNLAEDLIKEQQALDAEGDTIKALEVKTYSTAEELKTLDVLDELRQINRRFMANVDTLADDTLAFMLSAESKKENEEFEKEMLEAKLRFHERQWSSDEDEGPPAPPATPPSPVQQRDVTKIDLGYSSVDDDESSETQPPLKRTKIFG